MGELISLINKGLNFDDSKYKYRTIGISNLCFEYEKLWRYGALEELMFYDYDFKKDIEVATSKSY